MIKTFAYLSKSFNIKDKSEIVPILFFFNNKKMKGNIFLPENKNIKRGKKFFDEFLSVKYDEVDNYLRNLNEDPEIIKMFNNLYYEVMNDNQELSYKNEILSKEVSSKEKIKTALAVKIKNDLQNAETNKK